MATASVTTTIGATIVDTTPTYTVIAGAAGGVPPKESTHRFYHCNLDFNGMKCRQVESPDTMPVTEWTRLCVISKYSPKVLDRQVLRYKCMPENVVIEK